MLGSTLMGLAGALYVSFIGFVSPFDFLPILTFQVWAMLIVGGSGNNRGALLGALMVWAIWVGLGRGDHEAGAACAMPRRAAAVQVILIGLLLVLIAAVAAARTDRRGGGCVAARERAGSARPKLTVHQAP